MENGPAFFHDSRKTSSPDPGDIPETSYAVDLHVHSRFSTTPSQWILQKIGCAESYTDPLDLYAVAKARGMHHVTITDHNSLDGALEIAHLPDAFVSEEISAHFPEDGCEVHVLAWNITEKQHSDIRRARENLYELVHYLDRENIAHACAHPLCDMDGKLTPEHVEKLFLLFKVFEINGARHPLQNSTLIRWTQSLDSEAIAVLEEKHGITASLTEPWIKHFSGGSDDHSSCNIARTHTRIFPGRRGDGPDAAMPPTVADLLDSIMRGRNTVEGIPATPAGFAHNLYSIAYQFLQKHMGMMKNGNSSILRNFTENMLIGKPAASAATAKSRMFFFEELLRFARSKKRDHPDVRESLQEVLDNRIRQDAALRRVAEDGERIRLLEELPGMEETLLQVISGATESVLRTSIDSMLKDLVKGDFFNLFKLIGSSSTLYALLVPYGVGYSLFSRDAAFARACPVGKTLSPGAPQADIFVGHFTDTYYEINGVARTLQESLSLAGKTKLGLDILSCMPAGDIPRNHAAPVPIHFDPIGSFSVPDYPGITLHYPPVLKIIQHCYRKGYTLLHAATPGPMGLVALLASAMLKIPIHATYHTAFPEYMLRLTNDAGMEKLMWRYIGWYYKQMDAIFVPSEATARSLEARGFPRERMHLYPRGIDAERYTSARKAKTVQMRASAKENITFLYVGRISKEKNLDLLVDAFAIVCSRMDRVRLLVTGGGPMLEEMRGRTRNLPVTFTGFLQGNNLLQAYGQGDIFVFPSITDTFGNVVLEAQAAGLAVIVSAQGGPIENIVEGRTGIVAAEQTASCYAGAMLQLAGNPERLLRMQREAARYAQSRSQQRAFAEQWQLYRKVCSACHEAV